MRKKYAPEHVMIRHGIYYYVRHIPYEFSPNLLSNKALLQSED